MTTKNDKNLQDCGDFVLLSPPAEIVGLKPPRDRIFEGELDYKGVFIPGSTVKLSPYYFGKYPVTYELWKKIYTWAIKHGYTFENSGSQGYHGDERNTKNDPVTEVSWLDCVIWCNAYTEKEKGIEHCVYRDSNNGTVIKSTNNLNPSQVRYDQSKKGYRLPTEAEWEYVVRYQGDDSTNALLYGDIYLTHLDSLSGAKDKYSDKVESQRVAWDNSNSESKTHPVDGKDPNYVKLYDMSGNVFEWCYDGQDSLPTGTQTNPVGAALADLRIMRGGSWFTNVVGCTVAFRHSIEADKVGSNMINFGTASNLGLRVACNQ